MGRKSQDIDITFWSKIQNNDCNRGAPSCSVPGEFTFFSVTFFAWINIFEIQRVSNRRNREQLAPVKLICNRILIFLVAGTHSSYKCIIREARQCFFHFGNAKTAVLDYLLALRMQQFRYEWEIGKFQCLFLSAPLLLPHSSRHLENRELY